MQIGSLFSAVLQCSDFESQNLHDYTYCSWRSIINNICPSTDGDNILTWIQVPSEKFLWKINREHRHSNTHLCGTVTSSSPPLGNDEGSCHRPSRKKIVLSYQTQLLAVSAVWMRLEEFNYFVDSELICFAELNYNYFSLNIWLIYSYL